MAEYVALINFVDLEDNNYFYGKDKPFPRDGAEVSEERLEELASDKNKEGKPVIKKVEEPQEEPQDPKEEDKPKKQTKKKSDKSR